MQRSRHSPLTINFPLSILHHPVFTIKVGCLNANNFKRHLTSAHNGMWGVFWNENHIAFFYRECFIAQAHGAFAIKNGDLFAVCEVAVGLNLCFDDNAKGTRKAVATYFAHIYFG